MRLNKINFKKTTNVFLLRSLIIIKLIILPIKTLKMKKLIYLGLVLAICSCKKSHCPEPTIPTPTDSTKVYVATLQPGSEGKDALLFTLDQTKNYEIDLGIEKTIGNFYIKPKVFYSVLKDYIYNSTIGTNRTQFQNIDAKIYGFDISGHYYFTDNFAFDYGVAYQRGKKDGDFTDKDLAEIPPLKANLGLSYEYEKSKFKAEVVAVDRWSKFDDSAKEQEIAGYAVTNLKYTQELFKHFELTLGVDNLFDKVYNSTNTYQDIRYVEVGGEQILFNDPGRYGYVNLKYSF